MPAKGSPGYEKHRQDVQERQAEQVASWQDISPLPKVKNRIRRNRTIKSLERFCKTYLPQTFLLGWSPDHLRVIARMEQAVTEGGLFALAMPRGSGKTSLAEAACLWALLHAHRAFVVLIGSDEAAALRMLASVKVELEVNELLLADFPESVYPIHCLDRTSKRAKGQKLDGLPTYVGWSAKDLVIATVPGSKASGSVVKVAGLTASVRGLKHKRPDGTSVRPDLVIVDDPQSDESAASPTQCAYRERVLSGAVLGMAGPGKAISGIMPCTVILPGDLADRMLDRDLHPGWQGERCRMVYEWPARMDLWEQYRDLRLADLAQGGDGSVATDFYRERRREMDLGARVAWAERVKPGELSALQGAMNLRWQNRQGSEAAFMAEYQNDPMPLVEARPDDLTAAGIMARTNRHERGVAPAGSTRLTAFVDVQASLLYWLVVAWADDFTGAVIDYGTTPDQHRAYYTLRDARPTLADLQPEGDLDARLWAGLMAMGERVLGREYAVDGGSSLKIERCLIDANWEQSTLVVYRFCRQSQWSAVLAPSRGKGITAGTNPMDEWQRRPGERKGLNWVFRHQEGRPVRHLLYDANFWKSFLAARLLAPMGSRGALTLWGEAGEAHRLLADHWTAEHPERTAGRGRELDEWKISPSKPDNHWFDCAAGCCVAASLQGVQLGTIPPGKAKHKRERVSYAEAYAQARK